MLVTNLVSGNRAQVIYAPTGDYEFNKRKEIFIILLFLLNRRRFHLRDRVRISGLVKFMSGQKLKPTKAMRITRRDGTFQ